MIKLTISITLTLLVAILGGCHRDQPNSSETEVTFYPAYGYARDDNWLVELRGWVHERRKFANRFVTVLATLTDKCNGQRMDLFKSRSDVFESDDKFNQKVQIEFDSDPDGKQYSFEKASDPNGIVELALNLSKERADKLLAAQNSPDKWLTYRATSSGHIGLGRIRLIDAQGISIVSDIDDTIKISEIPAGQSKVFDYTFCREFEAAPGMADRYRNWSNAIGKPEWRDVTFHYVSGGPQQLFGPLFDFLIAGPGGFPEGTFHLSFFPKNLLVSETRENLKRFAAARMDTTFIHKVREITKLMEAFPLRKFILVGDSGEVDPEVYRKIRDDHPQQVEEIWIRDLVDDAHDNSYRLAGMRIIPVDRIVRMDEHHYKELCEMVKQRDQPNKYQKNAFKSCD